MREVIVERVGGIEIVLGERERTRRRGGPGVHERGLEDLIRVGAAANEAAAIFDVHVNVGAEIKASTQFGKALPHDGGGDDLIDLDGGHVVAAGSERARDVPTTPGADDQRLGAGPDRVWERLARDLEIAAL